MEIRGLEGMDEKEKGRMFPERDLQKVFVLCYVGFGAGDQFQDLYKLSTCSPSELHSSP
jgi:hypothetical protein